MRAPSASFRGSRPPLLQTEGALVRALARNRSHLLSMRCRAVDVSPAMAARVIQARFVARLRSRPAGPDSYTGFSGASPTRGGFCGRAL